MRALGRVLLWLQLCGKRGALTGPARRRGGPGRGLSGPRRSRFPERWAAGVRRRARGEDPGARPSAGAALRPSRAVQVPAAACGSRPAPQRASVSRARGRRRPSPNAPGQCVSSVPAPTPGAANTAAASLPRSPESLAAPAGHSPRPEPSRPLPADPRPFCLAETSASAFPSVVAGHCLACPCALLQRPAALGRGNEAIPAGVVEGARWSGLCDAGAGQGARPGLPRVPSHPEGARAWSGPLGGPLLHPAV